MEQRLGIAAVSFSNRSARLFLRGCCQYSYLVFSISGGDDYSLPIDVALAGSRRGDSAYGERLLSGKLRRAVPRLSARCRIAQIQLGFRLSAAVYRERHFCAARSGIQPHLASEGKPHLSTQPGGQSGAHLRVRRAGACLHLRYCPQRSISDVEVRREPHWRASSVDRVQGLRAAHYRPDDLSHLLAFAKYENSHAAADSGIGCSCGAAGNHEIPEHRHLAVAARQTSKRGATVCAIDHDRVVGVRCNPHRAGRRGVVCSSDVVTLEDGERPSR